MPCNATRSVFWIWHSVDRASWYVLIKKANEMDYFSYLFAKVLYMLDRDGTVVKALCYKSEGRWFDSIWYHWNFSLI